MKNILTISAFAACAAAALGGAPSAALQPAPPMIAQPPAAIQPAARAAQPSAEDAQKAAAAREKARKESLKKLFEQTRPPTGKIGETFFEKYWPYMLGAAVVVLGGALIFARRRRAKIVPPYDRAMERFEILAAAGAKISEKEYAREVSQIVRDYIEAVHNIPAPERTTEEFLQIAAESGVFGSEAKESLAKILRLADMAKFAERAFSGSEREEIFRVSVDFVEADNAKNKAAKEAGGKDGNK